MPDFLKLSTDSACNFWNSLVESNLPPATIAHNPRFFSFYSAFLSLSPFYFVLTESETPVGLFPVVKAGNQFISMPHFSYGGILWLSKKNKNAAEKEEIVIKHIIFGIEKDELDTGFYSIEISNLKKNNIPAGKIEIRGEKPFFGMNISEKTRHFLLLKKSKEEQWDSFSSNLRRKISKAEKNEIVVLKGKEELLNDFVRVYRKNMHKLGSPAFGKSFFLPLLQIPEINADIFIAYFHSKPVGAAFCLTYSGFVENTWFSTLSGFNKLYTPYVLHWKMIEDAIEGGGDMYSFGRSTSGSGVHNFKKQWQAQEKPLYFSASFQNKYNLKNQKWLTKIWKVLPAAFVNRVGPFVAKRIY